MGLNWSGKKGGQESADGKNTKLEKTSVKRPVAIALVEKTIR